MRQSERGPRLQVLHDGACGELDIEARRCHRLIASRREAKVAEVHRHHPAGTGTKLVMPRTQLVGQPAK